MVSHLAIVILGAKRVPCYPGFPPPVTSLSSARFLCFYFFSDTCRFASVGTPFYHKTAKWQNPLIVRSHRVRGHQIMIFMVYPTSSFELVCPSTHLRGGTCQSLMSEFFIIHGLSHDTIGGLVENTMIPNNA